MARLLPKTRPLQLLLALLGLLLLGTTVHAGAAPSTTTSSSNGKISSGKKEKEPSVRPGFSSIHLVSFTHPPTHPPTHPIPISTHSQALDRLRRTRAGAAAKPSAPDGKIIATPGQAFLTGLLSGAVAGITVDLTLFPLDTIKTRLQVGREGWVGGRKSREEDRTTTGTRARQWMNGTPSFLLHSTHPLTHLPQPKKASKNAKFSLDLLKGVYDGVGPGLVASAPACATFFGAYDFLKRSLTGRYSDPKYAPLVNMAAAAGGDLTQVLYCSSLFPPPPTYLPTLSVSTIQPIQLTQLTHSPTLYNKQSVVRVPFEVVKQRMQAGVEKTWREAVKNILASSGPKGFFAGTSHPPTHPPDP